MSPPHNLSQNTLSLVHWELNAHVTTTNGRVFSLFASFSRQIIAGDKKNKDPLYAHIVRWALIAVDKETYHQCTFLNQEVTKTGLVPFGPNDKIQDPRLKLIIQKIEKQKQVLLPDRLFTENAFVNQSKLELDFSGQRLLKQDDGIYQLELTDSEQNITCKLFFSPTKETIQHYHELAPDITNNEDIHLHFIPRCRVEGSLNIAQDVLSIEEGEAWYEYSFKQKPNSESYLNDNIAWNKLSAQLDNGYEVLVYTLFDQDNNDNRNKQWAIVINAQGQYSYHHDFTFEALNSWTSLRTFNAYPTQWRLHIPAENLNLTVEASFNAQEFITSVSPATFWKGRMNLCGAIDGQAVNGYAFLERKGFFTNQDVDALFGTIYHPDKGKRLFYALGQEIISLIQTLLPRQPTYEQARHLIGKPTLDHYMAGLDIDVYAQAVIHPIRDIIDRVGKTWRSYVIWLACEIAGGNPYKFLDWLFFVELLQVGSLIIDDVQDQSLIRRGGPTSHQIYGQALAINAGTASFFIAPQIIATTDIPAQDKLAIYEIYIDTFRAGHAGQALDITTLSYLMPQIVENGNGMLLEESLLAIYRLKTAVPASSAARIGVILGGGSNEQVEMIGSHFEVLGLAFQIIDDVLNLRGFKNSLKTRGEDISHGKVTFPIAKAMSKLSLPERHQLWEIISSKPTDPNIIAQAIDQIEAYNVLSDCEEQAYAMLENSWREIEPYIPPSYAKLKLSLVGKYLLEEFC